MTYDIRPLSFGEILDRAFRVYLDNFKVLCGVSILIWAPNGILMASTRALGATPTAVANLAFVLLVLPVMESRLRSPSPKFISTGASLFWRPTRPSAR